MDGTPQGPQDSVSQSRGRSSMLKLSQEDLALLTEVLVKHRPDLMELLQSPEVVCVTEDQRDALRDAISHELMTTGLQGSIRDAELSPRGSSLDDLISAVSSL